MARGCDKAGVCHILNPAVEAVTAQQTHAAEAANRVCHRWRVLVAAPLMRGVRRLLNDSATLLAQKSDQKQQKDRTMADWIKEELKLKKNHSWKAPPGYRIFVADQGAVRFNIPQ